MPEERNFEWNGGFGSKNEEPSGSQGVSRRPFDQNQCSNLRNSQSRLKKPETSSIILHMRLSLTYRHGRQIQQCGRRRRCDSKRSAAGTGPWGRGAWRWKHHGLGAGGLGFHGSSVDLLELTNIWKKRPDDHPRSPKNPAPRWKDNTREGQKEIPKTPRDWITSEKRKTSTRVATPLGQRAFLTFDPLPSEKTRSTLRSLACCRHNRGVCCLVCRDWSTLLSMGWLLCRNNMKELNSKTNLLGFQVWVLN